MIALVIGLRQCYTYMIPCGDWNDREILAKMFLVHGVL
jgi:hypothetical protein